MNQEVAQYISKLQPWQITVCEALRSMVLESIPDATERLQYGKPHYLKNGHYACVISVAKAKISFMILNATELKEIKGYFLSASAGPERKVATITEGQPVDYSQLAALLQKAASTL